MGPQPERDLLSPDPALPFPSLLAKYPQATTLLSLNPSISSRKLGKQIGVGHDTANRIKREFEEERKKLTSQTTAQAEPQKVKFFGAGKTLSKTEVEEYSESFPAALEDYFQTIDSWLWKRQLAVGKDTGERPIWTDLDEQQMTRLTKVMIKWGQKSSIGASAVRGVSESADYVAVGSMLAPRFLETVRIYRETRIPHKGRGTHEDHDQ